MGVLGLASTGPRKLPQAEYILVELGQESCLAQALGSQLEEPRNYTETRNSWSWDPESDFGGRGGPHTLEILICP